MEYKTFVRKPFQVDVVQITEDNIDDCAELIGEVREEDGVAYILVDRRLVPNVPRAHIGFYMTRMGRKTRVFSPKLFKEQFMPINESLEEWLDYIETSVE